MDFKAKQIFTTGNERTKYAIINIDINICKFNMPSASHSFIIFDINEAIHNILTCSDYINRCTCKQNIVKSL